MNEGRQGCRSQIAAQLAWLGARINSKTAYFVFRNGLHSGFGGLGVACWPLVPKFVGSNPAEAFGFLGRKKSSARLPSEGK